MGIVRTVQANGQGTAAITGWAESHPLARYLNLPALKITTAEPLLAAPGMEAIIRSTAGNLLAAGELNGQRMVASGIELLPYEGAASPLISVLTLNIFDWLSASGLASGYRAAGSPLEISSDLATAGYLGGERLFDGAQHDRTLGSVELPRPGLVRLDYRTGAPAILAVDFFDERESNLLLPQRVLLPADEATAQDTGGAALMHRGLAAVTLLLLMLDIMLTLARAARHRRPA